MVFALLAIMLLSTVTVALDEAGNDKNGNGIIDVINTKGITGQGIVNEARKWLGKGATYWSGVTPWPDCLAKRMGFPQSDGSIHFDCSGFVARILSDAGLRSTEWIHNYNSSFFNNHYGTSSYLTSDLRYQARLGQNIDAEVLMAKNGDYSGLQPGDIIIMGNGGHVFIYAGLDSQAIQLP